MDPEPPDVAQWQQQIPDEVGGINSGPAAYLCESVNTLFSPMLKIVSIPTDQIDQDNYETLQEEFRKFYMWNEGFETPSGGLDLILSYSRNLKATVLGVLVGWIKSVCKVRSVFSQSNWSSLQPLFDRLEDLTSDISRVAKDIKSNLQPSHLLHYTGENNYDSDSGASDSSLFSKVEPTFDDIIEDLRTYMESLFDITSALEHPAADIVQKALTEIPNDDLSSIPEKYRPFVVNIQDRYPSIEFALARKLGECNWMRRERLQDRKETAHDTFPISDYDDGIAWSRRVTDAKINPGATQSQYSKSAHDQSLQSYTVTSAPSSSLFDNNLVVPMRQARNIALAGSVTSLATTVGDEDNWRRQIPALQKEHDFQKPFSCQVCGDMLENVRNQSDWKLHVYNDLEPYVCLFSECTKGIYTMQSQREWMRHEFEIHRVSSQWPCNLCDEVFHTLESFRQHIGGIHENDFTTNQEEELLSAARRVVPCDSELKCPFCLTAPSQSQKGFARHVGKHQREISLAALLISSTEEDVKEDESSVSSESDKISPPQPIISLTLEPKALPAEPTATAVSSTHFKDVLLKKPNSNPLAADPYAYGFIQYHREIRVLRIWPGKSISKIQCELCTIPIGLHPRSIKYSALSYWWGELDEVPLHDIEVFHERALGGNPVWGSFRIRDNLHSALLKLRHETQLRDIWVDAVCIDQTNYNEKNVQVSLMHMIYTQADNVILWLGNESPNASAKETFEFLTRVLDLNELEILLENPNEEGAANCARVISFMRNKCFSRRWVIQEVALARNATVLYGDLELEWYNFSDAIALFMTRYMEIKSTCLDRYGFYDGVDARALGASTIVHATTNLFRKSPEGYVEERLLPLEVLVTSILVDFETADPRDTIFAVLALASDTHFTASRHDQRIAAKYKKDYLDVYIDFIDYCIETSQSLDVLCRPWASMPSAPKLYEQRLHETMPTWIPWLSEYTFGKSTSIKRGGLHRESIVGRLERKGQRTYNASGGLRPWWKFGLLLVEEPTFQLTPRQKAFTFSEDFRRLFSRRKPTFLRNPPRRSPTNPHNNLVEKLHLRNTLNKLPTASKSYNGVLLVRGFSLGTVDMISTRISGEGVIPDEVLTMGGWQLDLESPIGDAQEVPDQLWRTMVANRGPNSTSAPIWYRRACRECLQYVSQTGDLSIDRLKTRQKPRPTTAALMFLDRVLVTIFDRKFFTTKANTGTQKTALFGLGSKWIKSGDMVCILFGCSIPVVLREIKEEGNHHYQFVGECYAHGVQEGEACSESLPDWPECLEWPYNLPRSREENFIKKFNLR